MARTTVLAWTMVVALTLLSLYLFATVREENIKRPYLSSDARAVELALQSFVAESGTDRASIMRARFPTVIRFGDVRCVALKLKRGWIGRERVYCFDMNYRRVTAVDTRTPEVVDTRKSSREPPLPD